LIGSAFLFFSALGVIPLLLLVFQRTKKIGGLISILVGVFGIVTQFGIISGIFLIIAGILALCFMEKYIMFTEGHEMN
jgi:uncharacterized membrane protein HdeD (DUF308 family)